MVTRVRSRSVLSDSLMRVELSSPLAHTLDETLEDREPVVPDLRVAEVDADDGHQLRGRRRAAGREETLVALREAGLTRAGHEPGGEQEREGVGVVVEARVDEVRRRRPPEL